MQDSQHAWQPSAQSTQLSFSRLKLAIKSLFQPRLFQVQQFAPWLLSCPSVLKPRLVAAPRRPRKPGSGPNFVLTIVPAPGRPVPVFVPPLCVIRALVFPSANSDRSGGSHSSPRGNRASRSSARVRPRSVIPSLSGGSHSLLSDLR